MKKMYVYMAAAIIFMIAIVVLRGDLELLDTRFFYMKSIIDPYFESIGADGRSRYHIVNTVDFFFISAFTLMLVEIYKESFAKDNMYKSLIWIPIVYCLVDSVETGIIFYMIGMFPETSDLLKTVLMIATPLKWFFVLSSLLVVVNGYLLKVYLQKTGSE